MKKCLTAFLVFLILSASLPTGQGIRAVVKMSAFLHHFVHHLVCQQEPIGVLGFIQLHYYNSEHHNTNHTEHDCLPFQHDHQNIGQQISFLLAEPQIIAALPKLEPISNPLIARPQHWLSLLHRGEIWQPPKA